QRVSDVLLIIGIALRERALTCIACHRTVGVGEERLGLVSEIPCSNAAQDVRGRAEQHVKRRRLVRLIDQAAKAVWDVLRKLRVLTQWRRQTALLRGCRSSLRGLDASTGLSATLLFLFWR